MAIQDLKISRRVFEKTQHLITFSKKNSELKTQF